jgi:hypothetical protein
LNDWSVGKKTVEGKSGPGNIAKLGKKFLASTLLEKLVL